MINYPLDKDDNADILNSANKAVVQYVKEYFLIASKILNKVFTSYYELNIPAKFSSWNCLPHFNEMDIVVPRSCYRLYEHAYGQVAGVDKMKNLNSLRGDLIETSIEGKTAVFISISPMIESLMK